MNKKLFAAAVAALTLAGTMTQPVSVHAENSGSQVQMYRLYNPNSGEHFYTASVQERNHLSQIGWNYEGVGWIAPQKSATPVYRLYNSNGGEHHYTMNAQEKNALVKAGWRDEGKAWYGINTQLVQTGRKTVTDKAAWQETVVDQQPYDQYVCDGLMCNFCGQVFQSGEALNQHSIAVHDAIGSYSTHYKLVHHDAVTHVVTHPAVTHQEPVYDAK